MSHRYSIQCDKLQRDMPNGEDIWATLMLHARRISTLDFLSAVDMESFLDEDESFEDYIADDPDAACYRYDHAGEEIYFLQHAGFESFFTVDGRPPRHFEPVTPLVRELHRDSLARVLLPANCPLSQGIFGEEAEPEWIDHDLQFIDSLTPRFRLFIDNEPVAGLSVLNGRVDKLYVRHDVRREGLASQLFDRARSVLGALEHSEVLTDDGVEFVRAKVRLDAEGGFEP